MRRTKILTETTKDHRIRKLKKHLKKKLRKVFVHKNDKHSHDVLKIYKEEVTYT